MQLTCLNNSDGINLGYTTYMVAKVLIGKPNASKSFYTDMISLSV